eukprot:ANDGO_04881.mRNA.1 Putative uncharacterized protein DDB_G0277003
MADTPCTIVETLLLDIRPRVLAGCNVTDIMDDLSSMFDSQPWFCSSLSFQDLLVYLFLDYFPFLSRNYLKKIISSYVKILDHNRCEVAETFLDFLQNTTADTGEIMFQRCYVFLNEAYVQRVRKLAGQANLNCDGSCVGNLVEFVKQIDEDTGELGISVKVSVTDGFHETGTVAWEAGCFLAEFAASHPDLFDGKSVLELGTGIGVTAIGLMKLCNIRRMTMTDYAPLVLSNLAGNVKLNEPYPSGCAWTMESMNWESFDRSAVADRTEELVIGADLVYEPDAIIGLCNVVQSLLQNKSRVVLLAVTKRNPETFEFFKNALEERCVRWQDMTRWAHDTTKELLRYRNRDAVMVGYVKPVASSS